MPLRNFYSNRTRWNAAIPVVSRAPACCSLFCRVNWLLMRFSAQRRVSLVQRLTGPTLAQLSSPSAQPSKKRWEMANLESTTVSSTGDPIQESCGCATSIKAGSASGNQPSPRTGRKRTRNSARSAFSSALLHVPLDWEKATVHKPCQYERDSNHLG